MVMPVFYHNHYSYSNLHIVKYLIDKYLPLLVLYLFLTLVAVFLTILGILTYALDKCATLNRTSPNYIDSCLQGKSSPHHYKSVVIDDPFNNRKFISQHGKNQPGVYVFKDKVTGAIYVGGAVNLYNRVTSYFMPSIVNSEGRRVYRYFVKYGYDNLQLTLFILPPQSSVTSITELEQFFIDTLKPDLNVDLIAGGFTGFHNPMPQVMRDKLRVERGHSLYIYDITLNSYIFRFNSKQHAYRELKMHSKTLDKCLLEKVMYLERFVFSHTPLSAYPLEAIMSLQELIQLFTEVRSGYVVQQPASKRFQADNLLDPNLSSTFDSINDFVRQHGGDRATIRKYLDGSKPSGSLYLKQ